MRRSLASGLMVLGLIGAAPAAAQEPPSYGGGRLPASPAKGGFTPTVGITVQPRGDRLAFRFDTELRCGRRIYTVVGRSVVPFDGRSFRGRASRRLAIGRGGGSHILFAWTLRGQVDGTIASGRLEIGGVRVVGGRRSSCTRKPRRDSGLRTWSAALLRPIAPAPARTSPAPSPGSTTPHRRQRPSTATRRPAHGR